MTVEQIECDIAGILGHAVDAPFNRYDAVIYWPNDRLFSLPSRFQEWEENVRRSGTRLPALHRRMWATDLVEEATSWGKKRVPEDLSTEPRTTHERELIVEFLRHRAIDHLRDEIGHGVHNRLICLCVIPLEGSTRLPTAFKWVSEHIGVRGDNPERVDRCIPPDAIPHIHDFLAHLPTLMRQPVRTSIFITETFLDESVEIPAGDYRCWGRHWYEGYQNPDGPIAPETSCVRLFYPHRNGAGVAKTALFVPERVATSSSPSGFVLLMPEPLSLLTLIEELGVLVARTNANDELANEHEPVTSADAGKDYQLPVHIPMRPIASELADDASLRTIRRLRRDAKTVKLNRRGKAMKATAEGWLVALLCAKNRADLAGSLDHQDFLTLDRTVRHLIAKSSRNKLNRRAEDFVKRFWRLAKRLPDAV